MQKVEKLERSKKGKGSVGELELLLGKVRPLLDSYISVGKSFLHKESQFRLQELKIQQRDSIQSQLRIVQTDSIKHGRVRFIISSYFTLGAVFVVLVIFGRKFLFLSRF